MKVIEAESGKKFKPGDFVYVKRILKTNRTGMVIRFCGLINPYQSKSNNEQQEVYEVLVGKKLMYYNEILLDALDNEKINMISKTKN